MAHRHDLNHPKLDYLRNIVSKRDPKEDFKVLQNIGSGTYGDVYKAIRLEHNTYAAIKVVKIDLKDDIRAICQEIHTLRDCRHPNIVQYYGSYFRRNKLWICMEYCGGGSMQDIYTNIRRPLDEDCIAFLCRETLKGLDYMHRQGKIHRDIKGANILLTDEGRVKIADFGVAAQITQTINKRNSFIGTPYWMAPEVAAVERKGGYDEKCDIWAVGITAIEYAELQPPMFDLAPLKALHILSMRSYKPPILQHKSRWSSKFHSFLKYSLTKNERRRPDADTMMRHEFVLQAQLSEILTQHLLMLHRNPGSVPLLTSDDQEEEDSSAASSSKHHPGERQPPERIPSTRRSDDQKAAVSALEEVRIKTDHMMPPEHQPEDMINDDLEEYELATSAASGSPEGSSLLDLMNEGLMQSGDATVSEATENSKDVPVNGRSPPVPARKKSAPTPGTSPSSDDWCPSGHSAEAGDLIEPMSQLRMRPPPPPAKSAEGPPPVPVPRQRPLSVQIDSNVLPSPQRASRPKRPPPPPPPHAPQSSSAAGGPTTSVTPPPRPPAPKPRSISSPVQAQQPQPTTSQTEQQQVSQAAQQASHQQRLQHGLGMPHTPHVHMGACFALIFEGCPLKINCTASWVHPVTKGQIILFGTNDGIYYLSLIDLHEGSMELLFPRRCLWLYVVKDTMMSLSGQYPQLYSHNLVTLMKLKSQRQTMNPQKLGKFTKLLPKRFLPTTKVADTKGCHMVSITRNPFNGSKYLCAALENQILVMEWFNPVGTFMEVKRIEVPNMPSPLLNFDLLIMKDQPLPLACLGVYKTQEKERYRLHLINLNNDNSKWFDDLPAPEDALQVVKTVQLEHNTVLICFQDCAKVVSMSGRLKSNRTMASELDFGIHVESIVCLRDSVLVFHPRGLRGKSFCGELTQDINDEKHIYRLLGYDRNIVVESRPADDPMSNSNVYLLAGHTDSG